MRHSAKDPETSDAIMSSTSQGSNLVRLSHYSWRAVPKEKKAEAEAENNLTLHEQMERWRQITAAHSTLSRVTEGTRRTGTLGQERSRAVQ